MRFAKNNTIASAVACRWLSHTRKSDENIGGDMTFCSMIPRNRGKYIAVMVDRDRANSNTGTHRIIAQPAVRGRLARFFRASALARNPPSRLPKLAPNRAMLPKVAPAVGRSIERKSVGTGQEGS